MNKSIGQLFEEYSTIISHFSLKYSKKFDDESDIYEQLNKYFPMHVQDSESYHWVGFSHNPLELVQNKVLSLSKEPFKHFFDGCDSEFERQFGMINTSFGYESTFTFKLFLNKKPTNMYLDKFGYILIETGKVVDKDTGAIEFISGPSFDRLLKLIRNYNLDLSDNKLKYITYNDFKEFYDGNSNVIVGYKTKTGWYGGSHRAKKHFEVGSEIEVSDDSLLLSSGFVEGYQNKDLKERKYARSLVKNGKIKITDDNIAKFLCYRLANSTG